MDKPCSPSSERNREPIFGLLRECFADRRHVLEVGSGNGQHAVRFAAALPRLTWQSSDRAENLPGIRAWLAEATPAGTPDPLELDVAGRWPSGPFDAVFSVNTLHIMGWPKCVSSSRNCWPSPATTPSWPSAVRSMTTGATAARAMPRSTSD